MVPKFRSSVWVVLPEILSMLRAAEWPQIAETHDELDVRFGALNALPAGEAVVLHGSTRRAQQAVETSGTPGKNDDVEATLSVFVNVPGFTAERTWDRLAELGQTIDSTFRDLNTGKPITTTAMDEAGVQWLWVTATDTEVVPADVPGASWLGMCMFTLSWRARI